MPRKNYHCKRTKRSSSIKTAWKTRFSKKEENVCGENSDVQLEDSEEIFNRLVEESKVQRKNNTSCIEDENNYQNGCPVNQQLDESISDLENETDIDFAPLIIERSPETTEAPSLIQGRRVVDIGHVMSQLEILSNHPKVCTMGRFRYKKEIKNGLFCKWVYFCDNCDKECVISSEPQDQRIEINDALVWGAMSVGIGFSQVEEMFSVLNVPIMGQNKYRAHETKVGNGAIIGAHTQKLIYLGVKNKFCFACANPRTKRSDHMCFKNYNGPSTGMESSVIVEGFRTSEETYGIVYKHYIGDGDSNVLARIQEGCSYGRYVTKIECANHATRCLNDHLHKLADNTTYPLESRKILKNPVPGESISRLERLVKGVRTAIKEAGASRNSSDIAKLRADLKNAPDHVFGKHDKCSDFCQRKNCNEENVLDMLDNEFLCRIRAVVGNLESKANSLIFNKTPNVAERYMGILAKFTGGKRINFTTGGSFKRRCIGAGLSHTAGPSWHLSPWRKLHRSPGTIFKAKIMAREKRRFKRRLAFSENPITKRRRRNGQSDENYGPDAQPADIEEMSMKQKCEAFLTKLADETTGGAQPEIETIGQHSNQLWHEKRVNRLTASRFGAVIKRMPHTSCHNLVKSILYPRNLTSEAVTFGRDHEDIAIQIYEEKTSNKVTKCGLYIDKDYPFLGASPDGLVDPDGLIEVKCIPSVKDQPLIEVTKTKKPNFCLEQYDNKLRLKRNHNYFYQIQGQLNITERKWCDFVVFTKKGEVFIERVERDDALWQTRMLPKLCTFYKDCILPEIVDSRVVRGMKIRDPPYILEAQTKKQKEKTNKGEKQK